MNHIALNYRQKRTSVCLLTITLFALLVAASPAWSGQGYHNTPGTACAAYNNYQANLLQRNHYRIYNPGSNPNSVWVICPLQRVVEDIRSTTGNVYGYINAFFSDESNASAEVLCIVRDLDYLTTTAPGGVSGVVNSETVTIPSPANVPLVQTYYWGFSNDDTSTLNYWTVTCKLAPGTGINSLDVYQQ